MKLHNMACEYNDFLSDPLYPKIKTVLNAAIFKILHLSKSQVLSNEQVLLLYNKKL